MKSYKYILFATIFLSLMFTGCSNKKDSESIRGHIAAEGNNETEDSPGKKEDNTVAAEDIIKPGSVDGNYALNDFDCPGDKNISDEIVVTEGALGINSDLVITGNKGGIITRAIVAGCQIVQGFDIKYLDSASIELTLDPPDYYGPCPKCEGVLGEESTKKVVIVQVTDAGISLTDNDTVLTNCFGESPT